MMKPEPRTISLLDIKNAMKDPEFVKLLPESLAPEIQKVQSNPGCGCNAKVYEKILNEAPEAFAKYFPDKTKPDSQEVQKMHEDEVRAQAEAHQQQMRQQQMQQQQMLMKNNWRVINCSIGELETRLNSLPPGRKQITLSRYEDQVTVIINEIDLNI